MHLNIPAHLAEIETRNRLRRECGLPPLDRAYELRRLRALLEEEWRAEFLAWRPELRCRVRDKLLARERRRRGNPNWVPSGMLSGGGMAFELAVNRTMCRLWQMREWRD